MIKTFSVVVLFAISMGLGQAQGACPPGVSSDDLAAPTDVSRTYIRHGAGEFGAPRSSGNPHTGVDILTRASYDDASAYAVHAMGSGTVAYAQFNGVGLDNGFGNTIVIDHGGDCYTMYAHLSSDPFTPMDDNPSAALLVSVGQHVDKGEVIGYFVDQAAGVYSTGNAMRTAAGARWQTHVEFWNAPSGATSSGSLKDIYIDGDNRVDPTSSLLSLGYQIEDAP